MLRAILIDDEPGALAALRTLLAEQTAVPVIVAGEARTLLNARALLAGDAYDIVFLDIQLRGGSGFELVPAVRPGARIVFVTTHSEFSLRAFEVNALDYLVKPVAPGRLEHTLGRLHAASLPAAPSAPASPAPGRGYRPDDSVYLESDGAACFVPLRQIAAILSGDNYTEVRLTNGRGLLVRRPLADWESTLAGTAVVRAHRQALVNLAAVVRVVARPDEGAELHLDGVRDPVVASRRLWPALRAGLAEYRLQQRTAG
jgi:two-component system LytT family response regulator